MGGSAHRNIASKPPDVVSDVAILTPGTDESIDFARRLLDYLRRIGPVNGIVIADATM